MIAAFFDSNIAVYAADPRDASERKRQLSRHLLKERLCMFSTQVLMETYNVLVRMDLLDPDPAHAYVRRLAANTIVNVEREDVLEALDIRSLHRVSHWDGLILHSAAKSGATTLYSEDLNHGQTYGSVRVCNPFIEDFLA